MPLPDPSSDPNIKRERLLDRLADHVLAEGLSAATVKSFAAAAGTSDRMLLYYFPTKNEIVFAALGRVAERMTAILNEQAATKHLPYTELEQHLVEALTGEALWPFMRVWLEIASFAAGGDADYRRVGRTLGDGFLEWGAAQLDVTDEHERARLAARLFTTIEGLVLLKAIGMEDEARRGLDIQPSTEPRSERRDVHTPVPYTSPQSSDSGSRS